MKSTEFITEDVNIDVIKQIAENIKRDCQPFLQSIGFPNNTKWLYRGMDIRSGQPAERYLDPFPIRKDRRPLHTASKASAIIDEWLYSKVGWYPRSEGLFAIANRHFAEDFGGVHIIFPVGNFQSVWSENIDDMTYRINKAIGTVAKSDENSRDYTDLTPKIIKLLEAGKWHKNDKISNYLATAPNNEITISADSFYALPLSEDNPNVSLRLVKEYL